jgi:hypothetical protein
MCLHGDFADYADFCGHPRPSWAVNVLVTALGEVVAVGVSCALWFGPWRVVFTVSSLPD